jgi:hypothetical protein
MGLLFYRTLKFWSTPYANMINGSGNFKSILKVLRIYLVIQII